MAQGWNWAAANIVILSWCCLQVCILKLSEGCGSSYLEAITALIFRSVFKKIRRAAQSGLLYNNPHRVLLESWGPGKRTLKLHYALSASWVGQCLLEWRVSMRVRSQSFFTLWILEGMRTCPSRCLLFFQQECDSCLFGSRELACSVLGHTQKRCSHRRGTR